MALHCWSDATFSTFSVPLSLYAEFIAKFRGAAEKLRARDFSAVLPLGCFPPAVTSSLFLPHHFPDPISPATPGSQGLPTSVKVVYHCTAA
jgi:hypothetical protein